MPCFNNNLKKYTRIVETSYYYINKNYFYPIKLRFELYDKDDPEKEYFTDHQFFDIIFNPEINDELFSNFEENTDSYSVQYIDQL